MWFAILLSVAQADICTHYLDQRIDKGCLVAKTPQAKIIDRMVDEQLREILEDVSERQRTRVLNFVARVGAAPLNKFTVVEQGELILNSVLRQHPLSWLIIPHQARHFLDTGFRSPLSEKFLGVIRPGVIRARQKRAARLDYRLARRLLETPGFDPERALREFPRSTPPARLYDVHRASDDWNYGDVSKMSAEVRQEYEADILKRADHKFRRIMYFASCLSEDEYADMRLKRGEK